MTADALFIYAAKPSGHQAAARAVRAAIKNIAPRTVCAELDFFTKSYPVLGPAIASLYLETIRLAPNFWNYLYSNGAIKENSAEIREFFRLIQLPRVKKYITSFRPAAVISTHAATAWLLAEEKIKKPTAPRPFFLGGVITDFEVNNYWPLDGLDVYFAPTPEAKSDFASRGVPPHKIAVTGIPAHPEFSAPPADGERLRRELGLTKNAFTVLAMGGARGVGDMESIIAASFSAGKNIQTLVVCGHNTALEKKLSAKYAGVPSVRVLGFTTRTKDLMDISDVLVTKAGGMTISEALHRSLPMIVYDPLPAQEERNAEYIVGRAAAVFCLVPRDLKNALSALAVSPSKIAALRARMKDAMPLGGAEKIARLIIRRAGL